MEEQKNQIENQISQLKEVIGNLENKNFKLYELWFAYFGIKKTKKQ